MNLYFNEIFDVDEGVLDDYGAFNIALVVDLPLFADPFLLFNSNKPEYIALHDGIIDYLIYLRDISLKGGLSIGDKKNLFCFPEVSQNWLGFSTTSNAGRGLGIKFASALSENLNTLFQNFGNEQVTQGSHLEKLCLIREGVGRDMISDFTTNLIKRFLCEYTEKFAKENLSPEQIQTFAVPRVNFSAKTKTWQPGTYELPVHDGDFVLLTPKDILTKDDAWINKKDFFKDYFDIAPAIQNDQLRANINQYFAQMVPKNPTAKEEAEAIRKTSLKYPELIDYYIRHKEDNGEKATKRSRDLVKESLDVYVKQFGKLVDKLHEESNFYTLKESSDSLGAALERANYLKDIIENKGGQKLFYHDGVAVKREADLQILYRLVWFETNFDVGREVNDGRGPVDFKISNGAKDKTLIEMKLASNSQLKRNLEKQLPVYQKASDAEGGVKVIIYFSARELARVQRILRDLNVSDSERIILIDARNDNKPSGSKA